MDKIENKIKRLYENGLSGNKIAEKIDKSSWYVYTRLRNMNVKIRSQTETSRKYHLNESFFEDVNEENQLYWLGFILADGTIIDRGVKLTVSPKDKEHLNKFKSSLESNHKIYESSGGRGHKNLNVAVYSKKLRSDLEKLGIKKRKTFTVKPPKNLKRNKHFWRGVFDGDGGIYMNQRIGASLTGSLKVVKEFVKYMNNKIDSSTSMYKRTDSGIYGVMYGGCNTCFNLAKTLYEGGTIYLDRKYKKYEILKEKYGV